METLDYHYETFEVGDTVFYQQKEWEVISVLYGDWLLIKRSYQQARWVHVSNVMKLRSA